jgi:hypothetical protein
LALREKRSSLPEPEFRESLFLIPFVFSWNEYLYVLMLTSASAVTLLPSIAAQNTQPTLNRGIIGAGPGRDYWVAASPVHRVWAGGGALRF